MSFDISHLPLPTLNTLRRMMSGYYSRASFRKRTCPPTRRGTSALSKRSGETLGSMTNEKCRMMYRKSSVDILSKYDHTKDEQGVGLSTRAFRGDGLGRTFCRVDRRTSPVAKRGSCTVPGFRHRRSCDSTSRTLRRRVEVSLYRCKRRMSRTCPSQGYGLERRYRVSSRLGGPPRPA